MQFPLAQQEEESASWNMQKEKLDPCSMGKTMKLSTRFELNCLLLLYGTKDNIEVENNKVAKKNCLDLLDNSIEVGNERIISCSNGSSLIRMIMIKILIHRWNIYSSIKQI